MSKRKSIPPKVLNAENDAITRFIFERTYKLDDAKLPLCIFWMHYMGWRLGKKLPSTELTIDGFGRLFPKSFKRKSSYWPPARHSLKCVFGVALK